MIASARTPPLSAALVNPFNVYILAFGGAAGAFSLGWSSVYPPVSAAIAIALGVGIAIAVLLALVTRGLTDRIAPGDVRLPDWLVYPVALMFVADAFHGGLPLLRLMQGTFVYGAGLGIPHLHVVAVTFATTFSAIRFADFLATRRLRYLLEAVLPVVYLLAILYRGPAAITLVSWGFVYLAARRPGPRALAGLALAAIVGLYGFGLAGDFRMPAGHDVYSLGKPSEAFRHSWVPKPYFWAYTYFAAPFANLARASEEPHGGHSTAELVVSELVPDVLSKRLLPLVGSEGRVDTPQVAAGINVATIFGRAMVYAGWPGVALVFAWLCSIVLGYLRLIRDSALALPSLALLNTLIVFCTFDNMIAHSGVSLQIVWPLLLSAWLAHSRRRHARAGSGGVGPGSNCRLEPKLCNPLLR